MPAPLALVRVLGQYCGSTALALAMHSHQVAIAAWRWRQDGAPVEPLLRRIAREETILVTSGGSDWLAGSGRAERVDGGYRITGRKVFASGAPAGDLFMTMAVVDAPEGGATVLHVAIPLDAPGLEIVDTWHTLGIEERGIANLARLAGNGNGRNTVVAAVTITSDRARAVPVRFGFSDRVRVYLNGRMLYAGDDGFGTHDPDFLGIVGLFDELALPLKRGPNELWFAVSETFGGWAITADLPDRYDITVSP